MDNFKPMQPCDWFEDKVKFPCIIQPKVDGVASYGRHGSFIGRSLKQHDNRFITSHWSQQKFHGFGGEMTLGSNPCLADLCRLTSSVMRRFEGEPEMTWWLFDYITDDTRSLRYIDRMNKLEEVLQTLYLPDHNIQIIESILVYSMEELLEYENKWLEEGYEGLIIRDPNAPYKYGRCGKTFMGAWRIKRFIDAEAIITSIEEGEHNANDAKTNELGRTERSTHKENMIPNGLVGNLKGVVTADVFDPQTKELLLYKGQEITISPGKMDHDLRKYYFENQSEIIGKPSKFKFFPKGIKDKPRFPVWLCIRNESDIGE